VGELTFTTNPSKPTNPTRLAATLYHKAYERKTGEPYLLQNPKRGLFMLLLEVWLLLTLPLFSYELRTSNDQNSATRKSSAYIHKSAPLNPPYTLCGPRFLCCWHLVMIAERRRVRRSSGSS
jgi:hypothetical protein